MSEEFGEEKRERDGEKKKSGETVQVQRLTAEQYCGTKRGTWITWQRVTSRKHFTSMHGFLICPVVRGRVIEQGQETEGGAHREK